MLQNRLNNTDHVVSVFSGDIQCEFAMVADTEILFYISYSLCLTFRLCSSMIVFYTSLEVIKLAFLKNKVDIFAVYLLTSYSHLKQKINQCLKKNRVVCIL